MTNSASGNNFLVYSEDYRRNFRQNVLKATQQLYSADLHLKEVPFLAVPFFFLFSQQILWHSQSETGWEDSDWVNYPIEHVAVIKNRYEPKIFGRTEEALVVCQWSWLGRFVTPNGVVKDNERYFKLMTSNYWLFLDSFEDARVLKTDWKNDMGAPKKEEVLHPLDIIQFRLALSKDK